MQPLFGDHFKRFASTLAVTRPLLERGATTEAAMEASEGMKSIDRRAEDAAANQLAVADWSPSPAASNRPAKGQEQTNRRASSTDVSTESDSEKDAAEAFRGSHGHLSGKTNPSNPTLQGEEGQCWMM